MIEGEWVDEDVSPSRPSFDEFVEHEFAPTLALGLALLHDEDDALDVAQETMARALERWGEVAGLDRPGAWSRRVALNLVTDKLRARTRRRRLTGRLVAGRPDHVIWAEFDAWDAAFWSQVASLPERQRNVIVLFYVHDLSVTEIAEVVDAAEGTVKSDLSRARDRLRRSLAGEWS